jgi:preprotein translocase subunit SecD
MRGFEKSWRTIIVANTSTLIGAVILWWLSIGSVRGFAFFLGLSSLTSMIAVYFFTRPAILLIANWGRLNTRGVLGVKSSPLLGSEKA